METPGHALGDLLDPHIAPFLDALPGAGYSPRSVALRRTFLRAFVAWTRDVARDISDIDTHVAAFLARRRRHNGYRKHERATVRRFITWLRQRAVLPAAVRSTSPVDAVVDRYVAYLRTERGLAENSIAIYAPCARAFLVHRMEATGQLALDALDAEAIRTFLLARVADRSTESARLLSIAVRSLLRFLFQRGALTRDLSPAVPMVRTYRQTSVPVVLSPAEVERALATADTATPRGRRDLAVLLLLARLGLRASEVLTLALGDIHWRAAEIVIRGKGPRRDHVPLLADVGAALAQYLREDRGGNPSRQVFLRLIPPHVGLTRPCAIARRQFNLPPGDN